MAARTAREIEEQQAGPGIDVTYAGARPQPTARTQPTAPSYGKLGQPTIEEPSEFRKWISGELGSFAGATEPQGDYARAGIETVSQLSDVQAQLAQEKRAADLERWQQEGKWWFDPNRNVEPDLDQYMSSMPSATGALSEGLLIGGIHDENEVAGYFLNPIAAIATKAGADPNMASYVSEEGGYGALEGFAAGGWIGAIVGGAVGVLKGVFGWESAVEEDKAAKKRARREYERRLKEWQAARNKRINEAQLGYESARRRGDIARRAELGVRAEREKQKRLVTAKEQRQALVDALTGAASARSSLRAARLGRWQ